MKLCRRPLAGLLLLIILAHGTGSAAVVISEFMASNSTTLADQDGEYSDWIELHNDGAAAVELEGWGLTDSSGDLFRWVFPTLAIQPGERLIVFASGKDRAASGFELHTNFSLAAVGEYLALTSPDGTIQTEFAPTYPPQLPDVAYGQAALLSSTRLVQAQAPVQYLVPNAETLPATDWNLSGSAMPTGFTPGTNGIGYDGGTDIDLIPAVETADLMQPAAYWRLNEASGARFMNRGTLGTAADLDAFGSVTPGAEGPSGEGFPGFEPGNIALQLSGELGTYLSAGAPLMNNLTAFTVAGWVRTDSTLGSRTGLFGQNDAVEFGIVSRNTLHLWTPGGGSVNADAMLTPDQWHFIAAVGDGSRLFIYMDGQVLSSSWQGTANYGSSNFPFTVGGRAFDESAGELQGDIDEVLLFTHALSEEELNTLYRSAIQQRGVTEELAALHAPGWWSLESIPWFSNAAVNSGTLGEVANAQEDGTVSIVDGPRPVDFSGFADTNAAADFPGGSRLRIPHHPQLNGPEFSISAWVKPRPQSGPAPIFSSRDYAPHIGYVLMLDQNGQWCFALANSPTQFTLLTGGPAQFDQWSLITGTYDGTTARIYVNGEETGAIETAFLPNLEGYGKKTAEARIGYGSPTGGETFQGSIDEVLCLDRPLSAIECARLYSVAMGEDAYQNEKLFYLAPYISTTVEDQMRDRASAIFVRIPFALDGPVDPDRLLLRLRYVDGFAAWLNGEWVAEENAPQTLAWDATAVANRPSQLGASPVEFDITPFKDFMQPGDNLLALQGLNASASQPDFLLQAELVLITAGKENIGWRYFLNPTPGSPNGQGDEDLGPIIGGVNSLPQPPAQPTADVPITITARVLPFEAELDQVTLHWRTMFGEINTLQMVDDGSGADTTAGDSVFTAVIPPNSAGPGQMIRWYVTATDLNGQSSRWPLFTDRYGSEEYLGTVIEDPSIDSRLPVLHLFVQNPNALPTRCSVFYDGELYDNIQLRPRGQTTSGFPKKPYKLDFNKDHRFLYAPGGERVGKVNLMSNYADKSKLRNSLAYEYINRAGSVGHWCFPVRIQRNGSFFSVAEMLENGSDEWLERTGLDPEGALYKIYNSLNSTSGAEKKTRKTEGTADLQELITGLDPARTLATRVTYAYDNIDIPQTVSYFAALALISSQDHGHKNFYVYRDTNRSGEWALLPWDIDLSWGRNWLDSSGYLTDTIFTGNVLDFYDNSQQAKPRNRMYDLFFDHPDFRMMYLARLRSLIDTYLIEQIGNPPPPMTMPLTSGEQSRVAASIHQWLDLVDPTDGTSSDALLDNAAWSSWGVQYSMRQDAQRIIDTYIPGRANWLDSNPNALLKETPVPPSQPQDALIVFADVRFRTQSLNPDQEFIELFNPNAFAVDVSDWQLLGSVAFQFRPGTVLPAGSSLFIVQDQAQFRARTLSPKSGERHFITGPWAGELSTRGGNLTIVDHNDRVVSAFAYTGEPSDLQQYLRITEVMYHPPALPPAYPNSDDLEFITLQNISTTVTLNLQGAAFTKGITYTFPAEILLAPGARIVVAKNPTALAARYGTPPSPVLGPYLGTLSNSGETIRLEDTQGEVVLEFTYRDSWQPETDGEGYSLTFISPDVASWDEWDLALRWRKSELLYGAPGASDEPPSDAPLVVINEVFYGHDLDGTGGGIELFNADARTADLSGWYLSNNYADPMQLQFLPGTSLDPGEFAVIDAVTLAELNAGPLIDLMGGDVWLFAADSSGRLTGYRHGVHYGGHNPGRAFGRIVTSTGDAFFPAQLRPTLGELNAGPLVGPAVIAEVMYHPASETDDDITDEYIKLVNTSSAPLPLFKEPGGGWSFDEGISFVFGPDDFIPARGVMLLVSFDPEYDDTALTRFMNTYGVVDWDARVRLAGPYTGKLSNAGETLRLVMPGEPVHAGAIPRVAVEAFSYHDSDPWPGRADGKGDALTRVPLLSFADDPESWNSEPPSPNTPLDLLMPALSILDIQLTTDEFILHLADVPESGWQVQTAAGPGPDAQWLNVPARLEGSSLIVRHIDNPLHAGAGAVFYRVLTLPVAATTERP
ncbi:MAG: lamin tail domain-containing protein [Verrucomicrobiota bacterium]|jgi:hypothetical protein